MQNNFHSKSLAIFQEKKIIWKSWDNSLSLAKYCLKKVRPSWKKGGSDYHEGFKNGKYQVNLPESKNKTNPKNCKFKKSWDNPLLEWMTTFLDKGLSQDAEDRLYKFLLWGGVETAKPA